MANRSQIFTQLTLMKSDNNCNYTKETVNYYCIIQRLFKYSGCLNISNDNFSILGDMSIETTNISCNYTIVCFPDPIALSGLIMTLIGLVLGLIIIFNRQLFTAPRKNNTFIVITLIIINVGAAFLMFYAQCHFLGRKARSFRKEIEDTHVCNVWWIRFDWIYSHGFVADSKIHWPTSCNHGLLVRRNVHCDDIYKILSEEIP
ncbi:unnamed protein product [Schistosoma margrebowiei]|uniref:Uncharacterized protein n=1 Tax=Schistosoma margrebowiei TaxID=48269 RepID=A0AA85AM44_9TREM|nr:unnamed protein product [Schistosoma margrebowiei]